MNPFISPAEPLLRADESLTDSQRADAFDVFTSTQDSGEFAQRIAPLDLPTDLKARLYDAHQQQSEPTKPLDRVVNAIQRLKGIDAAALDAAEQHPAVLKGIIESARR